MRAVIAHGAGDLRVEEVADPTPGPGEVLVRMEWGGICGSDLSYWRHGSTGTAVLTEPLILGHEVAGRVAAFGPGIEATGYELGDPVTVHPATVVGDQELPDRIAGRSNLHRMVRYFGSAAFTPHTPGGFSGFRVVSLDQLRAVPAGVELRAAAVAEPLGVALHAVHRAGDLTGRSVLVSGCGPIGVLVVAAARAAGAAMITAADVASYPLGIARRMGADAVVDLAAGEPLPADVEVTIEASGVPAAIGPVFAATARGGVVVQVGNLPGGPQPADLAALVSRELDYRGSYRFVDEITDALRLLAGGLDIEPLLTHTFDLGQVTEAFEVAAGPQSSKVMLRLG
ncbi:L-idonate 5-dehydrogenase [Microlunatus speluncae]|uniref:L-idonate 5-dehydrogenase n=1 Tax=Microlunatus speluncae TaxID=2594267 RepID=UPI0012665D17|nr:L-idonate 5-dehydrogenase [Microlunatus speluncae]